MRFELQKKKLLKLWKFYNIKINVEFNYAIIDFLPSIHHPSHSAYTPNRQIENEFELEREREREREKKTSATKKHKEQI